MRNWVLQLVLIFAWACVAHPAQTYAANPSPTTTPKPSHNGGAAEDEESDEAGRESGATVEPVPIDQQVKAFEEKLAKLDPENKDNKEKDSEPKKTAKEQLEDLDTMSDQVKALEERIAKEPEGPEKDKMKATLTTAQRNLAYLRTKAAIALPQGDQTERKARVEQLKKELATLKALPKPEDKGDKDALSTKIAGLESAIRDGETTLTFKQKYPEKPEDAAQNPIKNTAQAGVDVVQATAAVAAAEAKLKTAKTADEIAAAQADLRTANRELASAQLHADNPVADVLGIDTVVEAVEERIEVAEQTAEEKEAALKEKDPAAYNKFKTDQYKDTYAEAKTAGERAKATDDYEAWAKANLTGDELINARGEIALNRTYDNFDNDEASEEQYYKRNLKQYDEIKEVLKKTTDPKLRKELQRAQGDLLAELEASEYLFPSDTARVFDAYEDQKKKKAAPQPPPGSVFGGFGNLLNDAYNYANDQVKAFRNALDNATTAEIAKAAGAIAAGAAVGGPVGALTAGALAYYGAGSGQQEKNESFFSSASDPVKAAIDMGNSSAGDASILNAARESTIKSTGSLYKETADEPVTNGRGVSGGSSGSHRGEEEEAVAGDSSGTSGFVAGASGGAPGGGGPISGGVTAMGAGAGAAVDAGVDFGGVASQIVSAGDTTGAAVSRANFGKGLSKTASTGGDASEKVGGSTVADGGGEEEAPIRTSRTFSGSAVTGGASAAFAGARVKVANGTTPDAIKESSGDNAGAINPVVTDGSGVTTISDEKRKSKVDDIYNKDTSGSTVGVLAAGETSGGVYNSSPTTTGISSTGAVKFATSTDSAYQVDYATTSLASGDNTDTGSADILPPLVGASADTIEQPSLAAGQGLIPTIGSKFIAVVEKTRGAIGSIGSDINDFFFGEPGPIPVPGPTQALATAGPANPAAARGLASKPVIRKPATANPEAKTLVGTPVPIQPAASRWDILKGWLLGA